MKNGGVQPEIRQRTRENIYKKHGKSQSKKIYTHSKHKHQSSESEDDTNISLKTFSGRKRTRARN